MPIAAAKNLFAPDRSPGKVHRVGELSALTVDEYLGFAADGPFAPLVATRADIGRFVRYLVSRCARRTGERLANATIQQRITAVRLFYAYLVEERLLSRNPVSRGTRIHAGLRRQNGVRALVPNKVKLPWIPSDDQWASIVEAASAESVRDRLLLALAYDAALRREELVTLEIRDFSPADRQITIRAEASTGRAGSRIVHYSETSSTLYLVALDDASPTGQRAPESFAQPWSKPRSRIRAISWST